MARKGKTKKNRPPSSGVAPRMTALPKPRTSTPWFDPSGTRERVERALQHAGMRARLVGFEAVGIQEFIGANGRPLAMAGASSLVKQFDESNRDKPGMVFAGGGRGLLLVPEGDPEGLVTRLPDLYSEVTCGGQLAIAHVPFDRSQAGQAESLRWLRMSLDGAKDAARKPSLLPMPTSTGTICTGCKVHEAVDPPYPGPEGEPVPSCERCKKVVLAGRDSGEHRWTFKDVVGDQKPLALVSADGNNLGAKFASLNSLEELALFSALVSSIFERSHQAALPEDKLFVEAVVGGDDIRIFLPPSKLLSYVTTLAREVHASTKQLDGQGIPASIVEALSELGVGVGAVIAPYHYPAYRLVHMAHEFEDAAKRACATHRYRSAFDFVWLRSGEELSEGLDALTGERPPAISLDEDGAESYLARAKAILAVPSSQLAMMVSARADLGKDEFMNLFCYQVARSPKWQAWFAACGVDWHDRAAIAMNLPDRRLLDIAALSGGWS